LYLFFLFLLFSVTCCAPDYHFASLGLALRSSAAERAEADPELRHRRGEMVVLTFSQQGWGEASGCLAR
jgi:hypothetical protein